MIAEKCWGGCLCGDGCFFFHTWKFARWSVCIQEVVSYRNDLLPYLVSLCCTCTVAVVVLLHFSCESTLICCYTVTCLPWYSLCLSVFTQCLDDITAVVCSRQKVTAGSWDRTKHSSGPSNRPVCVWNELLFIENVSQTSVCVTSSV